MSDLAREVKGVRPLVRNGKQSDRFIEVDLRERGPGFVTLGQLAEQFHLPPGRVLKALTTSSPAIVEKTNRWAMESLYQQEALIFDEGLGLTVAPSALADPPRHSRATKRAILEETAHASKRVLPGGKMEAVFLQWSLPMEDKIVLYRSKNFRSIQQRYKAYIENKPELDNFAVLVERLLDELEKLQATIVELAEAARAAMPEFSALVGLHTVAEIQCEMRGRPAPDESPMARLEQFITNNAVPLFKQHLIDEPRGTDRDLLGRRDAIAKRILDSFLTEEWKSGVQLVVDLHDAVEQDLWDTTFYALEKAVALLPLTGLKERYCEEQVEPFVYHIAQEPLEPKFERQLRKILSKEDAEDYINGWKSERAFGESVLSIASSLSVATIAIGANLPGPMSLWVSIVHISLFHAVATRASKGLAISGLARAIINRLPRFAKLNVQETAKFTHIIGESYAFKDAPPAVRYKKTIEALGIDWDARLVRGAGIRRGTAFVAMGILLLTIVADPLDSYQNLVGFTGAVLGAGLAISDLPLVTPILERHANKIVRTGGIRVVAGLVSMLGVVSGALTMRDGFARGDHFQVLEGALGGTGAAISLAAWLCASMGYVPIPQYVMAVGTLLVLASIGVSIWRNLFNSSEEFVFGALEALEEPTSATQKADLGPTVTLLRELVEATTWRSIPKIFQDDLVGRGFPRELAEELTA